MYYYSWVTPIVPWIYLDVFTRSEFIMEELQAFLLGSYALCCKLRKAGMKAKKTGESQQLVQRIPETKPPFPSDQTLCFVIFS